MTHDIATTVHALTTINPSIPGQDFYEARCECGWKSSNASIDAVIDDYVTHRDVT